MQTLINLCSCFLSFELLDNKEVVLEANLDDMWWVERRRADLGSMLLHVTEDSIVERWSQLNGKIENALADEEAAVLQQQPRQ